MARDFATYVDTEVRFFDKLEQAEYHAAAELAAIHLESKDGVDADLAGGVCVMRVVSRATLENPDAPYMHQEYRLRGVGPADLHLRQQAMIMLRCGWQVKLSPTSSNVQWRSPHGVSGSDFESESLDCPPLAAIAQHKREFKHA